MDFPKYELTEVDISREMVDAFCREPKKAFMRRDLLCIFNDEDIVRDLTPDLEKVKNLDGLLLQVIAPINLSLYN